MKFILYCFEWLSGLKINYHKSEAYIFGMEEEEKVRIVNMLNCKLGELPMAYLEIPCNTRCYCSSYSASTVFIQWWLQYKHNSMKIVLSTNGVGSF
jgi:hypothetical protein